MCQGTTTTNKKKGKYIMSNDTERKITEEQAAEEARKYSKKVSENDVAETVEKESKIKIFFENVECLKKYWDDVCDIFSLLKDRATGKYIETPWTTIASIVGAFLYVVSVLDLIPDCIPFAGFLDDAMVFGFVLKMAQADLELYREWRKKEQNTINVAID